MSIQKTSSRFFIFSLVVCLFFVSLYGYAQNTFAAAEPVKLYSAKIKTYTEYPTYGTPKYGYYATGYISTQNLGSVKSVSVRYTYDDTNWYDVSASYLRTDADGSDVWTFNTPVTYPENVSPYKYSCKFAVKYTVNGTTYWDNNAGNNYSICYTNASGVTNAPYVLQKSNVTLDSASMSTDTASGTVLVKNLAYNKVVKIRYSLDNWSTYKEINAMYSSSFGNNVDGWYFRIDQVPANSTIKFAISYTVNGTTYWDNNFGANYTLNASTPLN